LIDTTLYGTTRFPSTFWSFDLSTNSFEKLHTFQWTRDGDGPLGGVAVIGSTVFGTAVDGGANNMGTIWSFDTNTRTFANVHDFSFLSGSHPQGDVAASGTVAYGITHYDGTLWSFDANTNEFTVLFDEAPLGLGGVAVSGTTVFGVDGSRALWSYDLPSKAFTVLHEFDIARNGYPRFAIAATGTTVFGTTYERFHNEPGTIWSFDTSTDTLTTLFNFGEETDARRPLSGLIFQTQRFSERPWVTAQTAQAPSGRFPYPILQRLETLTPTVCWMPMTSTCWRPRSATSASTRNST
jgi:uncharacterized repeat protein (TIGR03803 family)